jgi:hypothetical protein
MKKMLIYVAVLFAVATQAQEAGKDFTSKEFNWTIKVPQGYTKTALADDDEPAEIVFAIEEGEINYMELTQEAYDEEEDGDYGDFQELFGSMMEQNLVAQFDEEATVDFKSTKENIGGKEFYRFDYTISYPGEEPLYYMHIFSSLINKKDVCMSIAYAEKEEGDVLLKAWRASKFK